MIHVLYFIIIILLLVFIGLEKSRYKKRMKHTFFIGKNVGYNAGFSEGSSNAYDNALKKMGEVDDICAAYEAIREII